MQAVPLTPVINMQNFLDFKVTHPTNMSDILAVRQTLTHDIHSIGEVAKELLADVLKYSDAYIAKKDQKLDIKMGELYLFVKDVIPSQVVDQETWYFTHEDDFQCFKELQQHLKKGGYLVKLLPDGKYGIYASPEDAEDLQLFSGFGETWKTLVKAFTMMQVERASLWSYPVGSMQLYDCVVLDDWPQRPGQEPNPLNTVISEMSRLFSDWSEVICDFVTLNPYAYIDVVTTSDKVLVTVYDDIRAIQSSLTEMARTEAAKEEDR